MGARVYVNPVCPWTLDFGLELDNIINYIVKRLGLGLGTGTWDLGPGTWDLGPFPWTWDLGIESRIETTPSPSADSKMPGATTT